MLQISVMHNFVNLDSLHATLFLVIVMTCKLPFFLKDDILTSVQDQGLDVIAEGLDTLKNMAHDMNEVGCYLLGM